MKIHKLEIKNVRGIPDLKIEPKGKSFVIFGSNGSGKSAIIDAMDFLLKGNIDRLEGRGTDGISLKEHGPHINKTNEPENVEVSADVTLYGSEEIITIKRNLKDNELIFKDEHKDRIEPIIEQLQRGQHVFTRREILKLITSPAKDRSEEILRILKLDRVEQTRKAAVGVHGEAKYAVREVRPMLETARKAILGITKAENYNEKEVLKFVNNLRSILKVTQIEKLKAVKIKEGIQEDKQQGITISHDELTEKTTKLINALTDESLSAHSAAVEQLETILKEIQADKKATWNTKRYKLTKMGVELIRDTGECPLCDTEWEEDALKEYLEERINQLSGRQSELEESNVVISNKVNELLNLIMELSSFMRPISMTIEYKTDRRIIENISIIKIWKEKIEDLEKALTNLNKDYVERNYNTIDLKKMFSNVEVENALQQLSTVIKELFPEATPQQAALSNLIRLEERVLTIETVERQLIKAELFLKRARNYETKYIEARDEILNLLYSDVKESFVKLYKELHAPDEQYFEAELTPLKAGLKFRVDFFGKGYHPPHAMHSEGHQDSMGVCLFLALAERLNGGIIDLSILDDVVMSVDSGHRKAFCKVLQKYFPDRQFIITTHDTAWAHQLQKQRVVGSKQMLKLYGWTIDRGPLTNYAADVWEKVQKDIDEENINDAAAKLRRGLEEWARMTCGNLRAAVPYSPGDGGGFSDFMNAALSKYKSLLKQAKSAANSWGREELIEEFETINSVFDQIYQRTEVEKWAINPTVHYNEWENFSKEDFQDVYDAFKDITDVFICNNPDCGMALSAEYDNAFRPTSVRCGCGEINWNLVKK